MRNAHKIITTSLLIIPLLFLFSTPINANTITPAISEYFLTSSQRDTSELTIQNTENKKIQVEPKVYAYSPKDEKLILEKGYIFVKTDIDTFEIEPNNNLTLNYEIIPPKNIEPGTYFNLIILEQTNTKQIINQENPVNTTTNLSHLVVLHITESGSVKGINTDFANIDIQVTDKGFPFMKPLKIKYTYQNKTNYVLKPDGEIQVFNINGKYEPTYVKINTNEQKVYPGDTLEEEIVVNKWHILDLISERKIIGRFYNGLDENHISKETNQKPYTIYAIAGLGILIIGILLIKSIKEDIRK